MDAIKPPDALWIGFAQALSMIPGTSRSGATIMGGLLRGLSRPAATEFSFFLAIPTIFGATVLLLYKARHSLNFDDLAVIGVGSVASFVSAMIRGARLAPLCQRSQFQGVRLVSNRLRIRDPWHLVLWVGQVVRLGARV